MPEASLIEEILGVQTSDDGQIAFFQVRSGEHIEVLALPASQLVHLMSLVSHASGEATRKSGADPQVKHVFPTEWWNFQRHDDQVILSFRMPGGMEMSFQTHVGTVPAMQEALAAASGQTVSPPAGTIRQ